MIRWERVLILASFLTFIGTGVLPGGDRHTVHPSPAPALEAATPTSASPSSSVIADEDTWCAVLGADGQFHRRYGAEACGLE